MFLTIMTMLLAQPGPPKDAPNPFAAALKQIEGVERTLALATTTPGAMWRAAARDLAAQPPESRRYMRYLAIPEIEGAASRRLMGQVLTGHVHLLSRGSTIEPLAPVDGTDGALLRLNMLRYGWPAELWERLYDATPFDTLDVVGAAPAARPTTVTNQVTRNGWKVPVTTVQPAPAQRPTTRRELAPWIAAGVDPASLAYLTGATYSRLPVVSGQWFLNQTAAQANRKVGYYDWLGVKNEDEWDAFVGFDRRRPRRKIEIRESVAVSGVSHQPRAIARYDADEGGYLWYTLDFDESITDKLNALDQLGRSIDDAYRALGKDKVLVKKAASEKFGLNAAGFLVSGLFDPAGTRQDSAPDFVGHDTRSRSTDGRIHVNISCVRCHTEAGKQTIDPWVRSVFKVHPGGKAFPLLSTRGYEDAELLRAQYIARQLTPFIDADRAKFDAACREATGLPAREWQAAYAQAWEAYEDARVDLAWAANHLRVAPSRLEKAIIAGMGRATNSYGASVTPSTLAGLAAGQSIGIRQWERAYPTAQILLRSSP